MIRTVKPKEQHAGRVWQQCCLKQDICATERPLPRACLHELAQQGLHPQASAQKAQSGCRPCIAKICRKAQMAASLSWMCSASEEVHGAV